MTASPAESAEVPTTTAEPKSGDDFDDAPPQQSQGNPDDDGQLGEAGKKAIDRMKAEKTEAVKRASAAERELEKFRKAAMSDAERQVAEAETRGRQAAMSEFGKRLATSEIRASAATAGADLEGVFDYLDLTRFLGEDGEPDDKAIKAFVGGLPKKDPGPPSQDGGARKASAPTDMNSIIRAQARGGRQP